MKKIIFIIAFFLPICLKAQNNVKLGQSKDSVRFFLSQFPDKSIKVSKSNDSDVMIAGNGTVKTIIYYNNNFSSRISVTFHWISKEMLEQKLLDNSFKKVNDNELINPKANVRVDFIADKKQEEVTMIESKIDKTIK